MKRFLYAVLALSLSSCNFNVDDYVDPFIGTGGHGHTYPGAFLPYGMVQISPDTRTEGWDACSGYHYSDDSIVGFSHTHLSGTGCADLADILVYPGTGAAKVEDGVVVRMPVGFSHGREKASCGYYSVRLGNIQAELTATRRAGVHRYTFPADGKPHYLIFDLLHTVAEEIIEETSLSRESDNVISGYRRTTGWTPGQEIHFSAEFSEPFKTVDLVSDSQAIVIFPEETASVTLAVGISAVSVDNAALNRETEVPELDFDKVRLNAENEWRKALSTIKVSGSSRKNRKIFYTALYHSMAAPNLMSDVNGDYIRMDGTKSNVGKDGSHWSAFSLWDTFRTWHPLQTLTDTTFVREMVVSLLDMYESSGELPIWPLWSGETGTMIGYHSVSVIADAYLRGVRGFDAEYALNAMVRSSQINKKGSPLYMEYGYVPADVRRESVSLTLEYAYDDWCIARMAETMGRTDIAEEYYGRALNYINVFDGSTGFFRGKMRDGSRTEPFNIFSTGRDYTEATPWHYRFFVPHDVNGLVNLFGGTPQFISALDDLFTVTSDEMSLDVEDVSGFLGQYAHGNEPGHNFAYLYSYVGQAWKTQRLTRRLLEEMYTDGPDGIIGNEDCGQMSAWYICSALGLYPVCPGTGEFVLTAPLFSEASIRLANGRELVITADNPEHNMYIESVSLNGRPLDSIFVTYDQLMEGGELHFTLRNTPVEDSGLTRPYSMTPDHTVSPPYTTSPFCLFDGILDFNLVTVTPGSEIRYTTDGSEPNDKSAIYVEPLRLNATTTISARAFKQGYTPSSTVTFKATRAEYISGLPETGHRNSVAYKFHEGVFSSVAEMAGSPVTRTGTMPVPSIDEAGLEDHFGYEFEGYINVPEKDVWEFYTKSDDGSKLYIDGIEVVNNDGSHASVAAAGRIALDKGLHSFKLLYFEDYEGQDLQWGWKRRGEEGYSEISSESLFQ